MSKQEVVAMAQAPAKLQIALNKFQGELMTDSRKSAVKNVSVEELGEDYRPRQAGLVYPYTFKVDIDLNEIIGEKVTNLFNLEGSDRSKIPELAFSISVGVYQPGGLC